MPGRTTGGSILAFTDVHDYFEGRADWLACGLPREGEKAYERRALDLVVDDGHVRLDERVRQVRERVAASRYGYAFVVMSATILLGRLPSSALEATAIRLPRNSWRLHRRSGELFGVVRRGDSATELPSGSP